MGAMPWGPWSGSCRRLVLSSLSQGLRAPQFWLRGCVGRLTKDHGHRVGRPHVTASGRLSLSLRSSQDTCSGWRAGPSFLPSCPQMFSCVQQWEARDQAMLRSLSLHLLGHAGP